MFSLESIRRLSFIRVACLLLVVFTALFGGPAAFAFSTTFTGGTSNDWSESSNWSGSVPDSSVDAIIPYNKAPVIPASYTTAAAKTLTINVSGGTRGSVTLANGSVLTLGNGTVTTTIDGDLIIGDNNGPATLKIDGTHTIQGNGGTIQLKNERSVIDEKDSTGDSLILKASGTCNPNRRACSMLLHGAGYVRVELNNQAFVVADEGSYALKLTQDPKTGTSAGNWIAENASTLEVQTVVSGACAWKIEDAAGGTILIDEGDDICVNGTGDVTLYAGWLKCLNTFCTTGHLDWKSIADGDGWTSPKISTSSASTATFGLGGASSCPSCP